ncbi:hypothetical protein Leryth_007388 [Lithospermum erythrorhizon]|nr:hypothetical protein Leryth_007388 [Lithospermum erythrorhizon]
MRTKQSGPDSSSPKSPMGTNATSNSSAEIDTKAPFQSVKAAIGLFGVLNSRGANVHKRSKSTLDERVLEKETQHHLTIKELESLKEQLRNVEATKAQALKDLDKEKYTLETLTSKLEALCESKQAAIVATEDAKKRLQQLEEERLMNTGEKLVDDVRNQYKTTTVEISSVKQEITTLKQDFDATLQAKLAAFQEAAEAEHITQVNQQKASELSEEITNLKKELDEVKLIAQRAEDEHSKFVAEKEARIQSFKASREENEKNIKALTEEAGLDDDEDPTVKLEETNQAIALLTEQLNSVRATDMDALKSTTSELELAKKDLQQLESEQSSLIILVQSLKQKIDKNATSISQAEELKKQAEVYKQEAQTTRLATEETEKKLQIALTEAKEAKSALDMESIIKLTAEEVNELKKKADNSKTNADLKVATAMAQVETIKENAKPVLHKLEESQKEKDTLKAAIEDALKQAEMADAARQVVEGELQKWRSDKDHNEGEKL